MSDLKRTKTAGLRGGRKWRVRRGVTLDVRAALASGKD